MIQKLIDNKQINTSAKDAMNLATALKIVSVHMIERARLDLNLPFVPLNERKITRFENFLFEQMKMEKGINVKKHISKLLSGIKAGEK